MTQENGPAPPPGQARVGVGLVVQSGVPTGTACSSQGRAHGEGPDDTGRLNPSLGELQSARSNHGEHWE